MSLFSSLTNRIFVASALLAVISISIGTCNVNVAVTRQAERELERGLDEARTLIEENRRLQVEHFTREALLIADLPKLKAAVEPGDAATARGVVEGYQQQLSADLFMVTDRRGRALVLLTSGDFTEPGRALARLPEEPPTHVTRRFVAHDEGVLEFVSVPIWIDPESPNILGTLSIGFNLDRHAAARFRTLTNSEIAFGVGDRILASTLAATGWPSLSPLLSEDGAPKTISLDGHEYVARTIYLGPEESTIGPVRAALPPNPRAAKAIVLRSRTERLAFLRSLHTSLIVTAGIAVLAATVLSYGIARTVTRPLGAITAAMREMAATGDLTQKIRVRSKPRWEDEDARLLATTFNTMTDSIARFQREAAQRERLSSLGRLSTVVAHEIRNPLMIIKATLHGLRRGGVAPPDVKAAVADIDEEIARLNRIVTEVLDFAKPIKFDLAPADLNALCADAIKAAGADGTAIPTTFRPDATLPWLTTDAERLRLVLVNVLTNARHAVAARDGAARLPDPVTVSTSHDDAHAVIEIADQGVGIAPQDLLRVFDPYFTTRRTGTGLGLAISRNIVEGLGGTIGIESRQNEGTLVRIVLPVR